MSETDYPRRDDELPHDDELDLEAPNESAPGHHPDPDDEAPEGEQEAGS